MSQICIVSVKFLKDVRVLGRNAANRNECLENKVRNKRQKGNIENKMKIRKEKKPETCWRYT
jgi:hypothetical protein